MVNNFVPEWKRIPFPLIVLCNFVLTPNRTHPATTYGYEQPSPAGHAQVLKKLQPTELTARCEKERTKTLAMLG